MMSGDFNKSETRGISGAGEAVIAYFENFQRKYPKQLKVIEELIQEAAANGLDEVKFLVASEERARKSKVVEIRAFYLFLARYLKYLGYAVKMERGGACWVNLTGRKGQVRNLTEVRRNSSWDAPDLPQVFVCDRRDIVGVYRCNITWVNQF